MPINASQIEIFGFCDLAELHLLMFCSLSKGMFLFYLAFLFLEVELESHKNILTDYLLAKH